MHVGISGVARMSKLRGHTMGTCTQCMRDTHLLGDLGHAPAMKKIFELYTLRSLLRPFRA